MNQAKTPGRTVIDGMPNAEYHAHPAVSNSLLTQISRSPMHARAYLDGHRFAPTTAMQFGTAAHAAILEPARFAAEFKAFDGNLRTKADKEEYRRLSELGWSLVSAGDWDAIAAMAIAARSHQTAGPLLSGGVVEQSVFWTDEEFGVPCKCRPDLWRDDGIAVDVKTTEDASPAGFSRSMATYRYHVQAAHYMAGTGADRFLFVAIEKKHPYAVAVYELDEASLDLGRMQRALDLAAYAECARTGIWPGYSEEVEPLSLPGWAFPKPESEEIEVEYV